MTDWDHITDFLVVGSGAGMIAALRAHALGKKVLVIEKTDKVGGSTGLSGGVLWLPNNPFMKRKGMSDSVEDALLYFDTVVGEAGPASSMERRRAYIEGSGEMLSFLEAEGVEFVHCTDYPDYYAAVRGVKGYKRGRSVEPKAFNVKRLGPWKDRLRPAISEPLVLYTHDSPHISRPRTLKGFWIAATTVLRTLFWRLMLTKTVTCGAALIGRLLEVLLQRNVPVWPESELADLVVEDGRVVGAIVRREGHEVRVRASSGVLLASGGFSHNDAMRKAFSSDQPGRSEWSSANPGDTGGPIEIAMDLGAATEFMNEAWWMPAWIQPDGKPSLSVGERCKPGSIMVDAKGDRFFNEATPYQEAGQLMFAHDRTVGGGVPAWLIIDSRNRSRYTFGWLPPMSTPEKVIENGTLKRDTTLEGLARQCDIDPANLVKTVERFNGFAKTGVDEDFHRGEGLHEQLHGDVTHKPNASLGPVSKPPFYAAQIVPGDLGTNGGLLTDEFARVLRKDGTPIQGLYASGNCTASVMGRKYPGAGGTIGPAAVFGFVAANHAINGTRS